MKPTEPTQQHPSPDAQSAAPTSKELRHLLDELAPALHGDLRVRVSVPKGEVGVVGEVCNYMIEALEQYIRQIRSISERIIEATGLVLSRSVEMAQGAEIQMIQLTDTTDTIEQLVIFTQRLSATLQVSADIAQTIHDELEKEAQELAEGVEDDGDAGGQTSGLISRIDPDIRRQHRLLEEALHSVTEHMPATESTVSELYTFTQQFRQSGMDLMNIARHFATLEVLARQSLETVSGIHIIEEHARPAEDDIWLIAAPSGNGTV